MKFLNKLWRTGRRAREIGSARLQGGTPCGTCGFTGRPLHRNVLWPELVAAWELPPDWAPATCTAISGAVRACATPSSAASKPACRTKT